MSFPAYPEYKDPGVEWLGEVPANWEVKPLKYVATYNDEVFPETTSGDYLINYVEISDVDEQSGITGCSEYTFAAAPSRARRVLKNGDVLISTVRTYLRAIAPVVNPPENLVGSTGFAVIRPVAERYYSGLLGYTLRAEWFISKVIAGSVGVSYPAINASDLVSLPVPVPPWKEQQCIATFLDHETARIDALIAEQQRLIALLKEKRQAVISHAVTKGLDPDAPMKDSGVEWLGDVPAHWVVAPIKMFFRFLDGRRIPLKAEDRGERQGEFPYYGASGVIDWIDDFIFEKGHVLVSEDGANLLARSSPISFVARGRYWVNNHAHILEPIDDKLEYWAEVIENLDLSIHVTGSAQPKLTSEALGSIVVASSPSLDERLKIQERITKIDKVTKELIKEVCDGINLLQERRSALISAAVTGKIDVRGWQAEEQAEPEGAPMAAEPQAIYQ